MSKHVVVAVGGAGAAAVVGAAAGSVLLVMFDFVRSAGSVAAGESLRAATLLLFVYALIGVPISFLSLVLIGVPISYPFRRSIRKRPLLSALIYGVVGAYLGLWVTMIAGLGGRETLVPALVMGGCTAAAWIAILARSTQTQDQ
jgi:uncharacterized membrane protein YeaQ/YmgE (transglycosylase-associated protein family)